MLNWEKCHFMVQEGIVLGHRISLQGLELDHVKTSTIQTLMPPSTIKGVRSFLGHARFYKRFIKDFSKIARPMCRVLKRDAIFYFDEACMKAFEELKSRLVSELIMIVPDWNEQFEIMCDASDFTIEAALG